MTLVPAERAQSSAGRGLIGQVATLVTRQVADQTAATSSRFGSCAGGFHTLAVGPDGIRVVGAAPAGAHRALTTLVAIAEQLPATGAGVELPALAVADGPTLAWRDWRSTW